VSSTCILRQSRCIQAFQAEMQLLSARVPWNLHCNCAARQIGSGQVLTATALSGRLAVTAQDYCIQCCSCVLLRCRGQSWCVSCVCAGLQCQQWSRDQPQAAHG
jgi:hypothetical protein